MRPAACRVEVARMAALPRGAGTHLLQRVAELEDLPLPLHLPHTQLAADLCGGRAGALQREGAVEAPLAAAPHLVEGDLLWGTEGVISFKIAL